MSHIVSIVTQIKDPIALAAACRRLGLSEPVAGKAQLFSGEVEGLLVQLPGWTYPAVIDTSAGTVASDTFEGHWGDPKELDKLLQAYAVEKGKIEARRAGHAVHETALADGSIKLTVSVASFNSGGETRGRVSRSSSAPRGKQSFRPRASPGKSAARRARQWSRRWAWSSRTAPRPRCIRRRSARCGRTSGVDAGVPTRCRDTGDPGIQLL